jgi:hypothetical protein
MNNVLHLYAGVGAAAVVGGLLVAGLIFTVQRKFGNAGIAGVSMLGIAAVAWYLS